MARRPKPDNPFRWFDEIEVVAAVGDEGLKAIEPAVAIPAVDLVADRERDGRFKK